MDSPSYGRQAPDVGSSPARGTAAVKLRPRLTSLAPLARPRIVNDIWKIQSAGANRLVLVHAAAGFGKTTIMMQYRSCLQQRNIATGWLTVDAVDNDVSRFVGYLVSALRAIDPAFGSAVPERADGGRAQGKNLIVDLAGQLAEHVSPFALFIDDFEAIQNPTICELVEQLVECFPPHGQMIIGARQLPRLGIGRLRAHGLLLEVTEAQLRFTPEETAAFLRQRCGLALSNDHIWHLHKRADGWAAALWLMSLSLRTSDSPQHLIEAFDASNAMIMDYLVEDVLARQSDELRSFVLQTGVLNELSAELCDHITERNDGREMLAQVERANLFLVAQDPERRWYRYHKLFSDVLRSYIGRVSPELARALHRRAAEWYSNEGRPAPAIDHALLSGDVDHGLKLLAASAEKLLWQGRVRLLCRWFDTCRDYKALEEQPQLIVAYAWALTLTHRYDEATVQLQRIRAHIGDAKTSRETWLHCDALQSFIWAMTDRVAEALEGWERLRGRITPKMAFTYGIYINSYSFCLVAASRFNETRALLDEGKHHFAMVDSSFSMMVAVCFEGSIDLLQGRLRSAIARYRAALTGSRPEKSGHLAGSTIASAFLAQALYEANELEEAEEILTACLPVLKEVGAPDQLISSYIVLARIAYADKRSGRMTQVLNEMECFGQEQGLPRVIANARLERGRIALLEGDVREAKNQLECARLAETWTRFDGFMLLANDVDTPAMLEARIAVRSGQGEGAIAGLKQEMKRAEERRLARRALRLKILLIEALYKAGQINAAMRYLREAVELGRAEGFIRAFVDEAGGILQPLIEFRQRMPDDRGEATASSGLPEFVDHLLALGGHQADEPAPSEAQRAAGVTGTLSEREKEVLALLTRGYQNRAIAEKLFVSETTVKAHLRNINGKLGTHSRTHAIAVARQLGFVH